MAKRCTKNIANYMGTGKAASTNTLSQLLAGASQISAHAWAWFNTLTTGANDNRVFNLTVAQGATTGLGIAVGASNFMRGLARSINTDALQTATGVTAIPTGQWVSLGIAVDFPNATINIYLNGKLEKNQAALTFGQTTYSGAQGWPDAIGGDTNQTSGAPSGTAPQVDGFIAELSVYSGMLSSGDFTALASGRPATQVRAEVLEEYLPLRGYTGVETGLWSAKTVYSTGTIDPNPGWHPLVYPPPLNLHRWFTSGAGMNFYPSLYFAVH